MRMLHTTGRALTALALAVSLAGCATGPINAEDSAISLGKNLVLQSVPLGGMAVQALVSAGDGEDRGSYRSKSQLFCQTNAQALANIRERFAALCRRKGAAFDGQFCLSPPWSDKVLFSAKLEYRSAGCHMLHVSEAVTVGSPDYLKFLVNEAGYETAQVRADKLAERQAAAADARAKAQAEQQAIQAREMARLELELPQLRKRGARVCQMASSNLFMYRGYVEDFTDEKLKIAVAEAFVPNAPGMRPTGFQPHTLWDPPIRWRLC